MAEDALTFNKQEIGRLLLNLQSICHHCARLDQELICSIAEQCPVGVGRRMLSHYNQTGIQVIKDFDFYRLPWVPDGATMDRDKLEAIYATVHDLCNKCMFHSERCFMNIVYMLIEISLDKQTRKHPSVKPGDDAI